MSVAFAILCALIIYISYYISHHIINVVTVFSAPYMLIIPLNNILMVKLGFYLISNQTIYMVTGCLLCIFIGYIVANVFFRSKVGRKEEFESENEDIFSYYNICAMIKYTFFVEIIVFFRFVFIIVSKGLPYIATSDFEGQMLRGPLGHMLLTICPIVPVLFLYWLNNKRKFKYLVATIVCVGLLFTTFIKYHVIGMIVLIYLFVSIEEEKYARKGLLILVISAIGLFISNYLLSFIVGGVNSKVAQEFYYNHFWAYVSGSLINDNKIFTEGIRVGVSIFYKLGSALFALPNVFLSTLFGFSICPHKALAFQYVGNREQTSNVVDTFGYYFPSKGSFTEIILYVIVLILIGILFSVIYEKSVSKRNHLRVTICIFMTFFAFFSFFGTFYVLMVPWEMLLWSAIILTVFDKRKIIKFGRKRLF